jgi:hypothetical protein
MEPRTSLLRRCALGLVLLGALQTERVSAQLIEGGILGGGIKPGKLSPDILDGNPPPSSKTPAPKPAPASAGAKCSRKLALKLIDAQSKKPLVALAAKTMLQAATVRSRKIDVLPTLSPACAKVIKAVAYGKNGSMLRKKAPYRLSANGAGFLVKPRKRYLIQAAGKDAAGKTIAASTTTLIIGPAPSASTPEEGGAPSNKGSLAAAKRYPPPAAKWDLMKEAMKGGTGPDLTGADIGPRVGNFALGDAIDIVARVKNIGAAPMEEAAVELRVVIGTGSKAYEVRATETFALGLDESFEYLFPRLPMYWNKVEFQGFVDSSRSVDEPNDRNNIVDGAFANSEGMKEE